jgi:SAM-dependent methyltransferase
MDVREAAASFYDSNAGFPDDLPFYRTFLGDRHTTVLELGCGTGRVLTALAKISDEIHGVDASPSMLEVCKRKLLDSPIPRCRVSLHVADIASFDLGRTFDLIIAPFRVVQNLDTDSMLHGLFDCVDRHLSKSGSCLLNAFRPYAPADELLRNWVSPTDHFEWEVPFKGGILRRLCRNSRITEHPLVLFPDLIHQYIKDGVVQEEGTLSIAMRCFYPDEFIQMIEAEGFLIVDTWGGYAQEVYGTGPELVVQFKGRAAV